MRRWGKKKLSFVFIFCSQAFINHDVNLDDDIRLLHKIGNSASQNVTGTGQWHQHQALQLTVDSFQKWFFALQALQYNNITVSKNGFFLRYKRYSWQLTVSKNDFFALLSDSFTVLENVFFKMPQRKVNVITERRIFGEDNDLPRDIRDMKSGVRGILCSVIVATLEVWPVSLVFLYVYYALSSSK